MAKTKTVPATAADVLKILNVHSVEVFRPLRLPINRVQLSMPADDKRPRIKVSLRPGLKMKDPSQLVFDVDKRPVQVPPEAAEDYQPYSLQ